MTASIALTWYTSLGVGFLLFHEAAAKSKSNLLAEHYIPLTVWGVMYLTLGLSLLTAVLVPRIPHWVVRVLLGIGMVFTVFWLCTYIGAAFEGHLPLVSVIPAWATILGVEWSALREPELLHVPGPS